MSAEDKTPEMILLGVLGTFTKLDEWEGATFQPIRMLQIDSRGQAGEVFIKECLVALGHTVAHTNATNPQRKQWDLVVTDQVEDVTLEVKTATLGRNATFQHENLDKNRGYDGIVFLDIAPDAIYLTCIAKHKLPWMKMHRRKDSIYYKWDWKLSNLSGSKIVNLADFGKIWKQMLIDIQEHKNKQTPAKSI